MDFEAIDYEKSNGVATTLAVVGSLYVVLWPKLITLRIRLMTSCGRPATP